VVRITGWIYRFLDNCKHHDKSKTDALLPEELQKAEKYWIRQSQESDFPFELNQLRKGQRVARSSKIHELNPFLDDDGLIKLGGRLKHANLDELQKHPYILGQGKVAELLIMMHHRRMLHGGIRDTLTDLRDKMWILRGRQMVKRILQQCLICRRWKARCGTEDEAPLPRARVSEEATFSAVGLDFAGPLFIKDGEQEKKVYICLFTCATTRAVHLELVSSQGTDAFLLAFR